jgi:hypothetical protein
VCASRSLIVISIVIAIAISARGLLRLKIVATQLVFD